MGLELAITAARKVFSTYSGYQRGKLVKSDQALREEVRRRSRMIREHLESVHDRAHRNRMRDLRTTVKDVVECCDSLEDDARFSISSIPKTAHKVQAEIPRKILKTLVNHDMHTLERMVKATNLSNQLVHDLSRDMEESELNRQAMGIRQSMTGARNHFRERNMLIDGYTNK